MGVAFIGAHFDNASEVHSHHSGDVCQAEMISSNEGSAFKPLVECQKKSLKPSQPAFGQLRNLRIVDRAWQCTVDHGR